MSTAFYAARDNVYATYKEADHQFSTNIWSSPRLLFSYFKRPLGLDTQDLVVSADIFAHTLDLLTVPSPHNNRMRRRVDTTDALTEQQQQALIAFTGCRVNDISRACPTDCNSQKYETITGTCNNVENSYWGASNMPQRRFWLF